MEDSAVAWKNYLYVADNGGKLFCWDLNTMKLVWVQNVLDDTNTSPVFEEENGTRLHLHLHLASRDGQEHARPAATGGIPIWKIDAATGEIVWKTDSLPVLHRASTSPAACRTLRCWARRTSPTWSSTPSPARPSPGSGIIVALDKKTGKEVWRTADQPLHVELAGGGLHARRQVLHRGLRLPSATCSCSKARPGKILDTINLGTNIEASPAVFGNTIVVGTRGQKIFGGQDQVATLFR